MGVWSSVRKKDQQQILKLDSNLFNCLLLRDVNEIRIQDTLSESELPEKGQKPQLKYPTNFEYSMGGNVEFYKEYLMRGYLDTKLGTRQYRGTIKQRDISSSDHDSEPESFRYVTKYKPIEDIIREQEGGELTFDNYSTIYMPNFLTNNQEAITTTSILQENNDRVCNLDFMDQNKIERIESAPINVLTDQQTDNPEKRTSEKEVSNLQASKELTFIYNKYQSGLTESRTDSVCMSKQASQTGQETSVTKKGDQRVKKVKIVKAITKKKIESNSVANRERTSPGKHLPHKQELETSPSAAKKFVGTERRKHYKTGLDGVSKHGFKEQKPNYENKGAVASKQAKSNSVVVKNDTNVHKTNITFSERENVDKREIIMKETNIENFVTQVNKRQQQSQSLNDPVSNDTKEQERVERSSAIKNESNISNNLITKEKVRNEKCYLTTNSSEDSNTTLFPEEEPNLESDALCASAYLDRYSKLPKAFQEMARRLSQCETSPKANKPSLGQVKSIPQSNCSSSTSSNSSPRSPSGRPLSRTPSYKMPKTPSLSRQHPATYVTQHTSRSRSSSRVTSRASSPSRSYENDNFP